MVQKFDYPKSESELRSILDRLYGLSRKSIEEGNTPVFKGLLEVISAEATILTAIHNIKANRGSETHGSDRKTIRHFLENDYEGVIEEVKNMFQNYKPLPVRRVYIPKPGKSEKRPLGIPAIADRIVQECIRIVLDPIAEAHFFSHSYGFRPMREARMALQRVTNIVHSTGYHWVVEGDIKKFFDNVDHSILIKQLWHLGIRDRRILMIIKTMLKAGVMKECTTSNLGTPQGGIISPLLANIYLNTLDQWVTREWENKKTRHHYPKQDVRIRMLRKNSKLKPAYFVRYADDWVLITNSKSNAEKWKSRISDYLKTNLKLELSEDKTLITNITKKAVKFLGVHIKFKSGKARKGWIPSTRPNPDRLSTKVKEIYKSIRNLKRFHSQDKLEFIHQINVINSKIRGLIEYYQPCTRVNVELAKYSFNLRRTAFNVLKGKLGAQWVPANEVNNLISVHSDYTTAIPTIEHQGRKWGVTLLAFAKWQNKPFKSQDESPYTLKGRELYYKRSGKRSTVSRADDLLSLHLSKIIVSGQTGKHYNFEYFLNRAYAFNRDKGKCRVCGDYVSHADVHIHHETPYLPLNQVNRVPNLATVHEECHKKIHDSKDYSFLNKKMWNKILRFREKLKNPV